MNDILIGRNDVNAVELDPHFGNFIQHALRAFTPRDQKAAKAAAETFAPNPELDVARVIGALEVGDALASTLRDKGAPTPVERVLISTPTCRPGPISGEERAAIRSHSPVGPKYDTMTNREPAAEILARRADDKAVDDPQQTAQQESTEQPQGSALGGAMHDAVFGTNRRQGMLETMAKQTARTLGSQLGRQILRGALGGIIGGKR